MSNEKRTLSDEDVKALVNELEARIEKNLGRGLMALIWRVVIVLFLLLVAWGFTKGYNFLG